MTHTKMGGWHALFSAILAVAITCPVSFVRAENAPTTTIPEAYGAADPMFKTPYIDIDEWRDQPVRHHYVHGGFEGTGLKFSFYFPEKAQYRGRFFQHLSANTPRTEDTASLLSGESSRIAFAFASGGYLVESNMGGAAGRSDPKIGGFRASAAAADYSRVVAIGLFGGKRPYGYVYGGSGGAYRTIAAIENTTVWDGAVPYVPGSTNPTGVVATGHGRVGRMLRGKMPAILDTLDAGGSGNPYAGLDEDESEALREMLRFAVPPQIFGVGQPDLAIGSSAGILGDSSYVTDFWTKPGYEGADPKSYATRARVQFKTTVSRTVADVEAKLRGLPPVVTERPLFVNPVGGDASQLPGGQPIKIDEATNPVAAIELSTVPGKDLKGAALKVLSGAAKGAIIPIGRHAGSLVAPGDSVAMDPRTAAFSGGANAVQSAIKTMAQLKPGDEVEMDNSASLAADVYNRYALPKGDFAPWRQYRDAKGKPLHPQRDRPFSMNGPPVGGTAPNGRFRTKVIMLGSLWDELANPWNADWYAARAKEHWGPKYDDNYRLWFTDRAMHTDSALSRSSTQVVSFNGVIQQALRDVAAWAEQGKPPPMNTQYKIVEGQFVLPEKATARGGIQPLVKLRANGKTRAVVRPGKSITLSARIEAPPGAGKIIHAEWDFDGSGSYSETGTLKQMSSGAAWVKTSHAYGKAGTHFVTLRVTLQREGDTETPFAHIRNLGRVRIIVR